MTLSHVMTPLRTAEEERAMRSPQLVIHETEGHIAEQLRGTAGTWQWTLREVRDPAACLRTLLNNSPTVVVLEWQAEAEEGYSLLEQITTSVPATPVVAVVRGGGTESLALAWDLGATAVVGPGSPPEVVLNVVLGLMEALQREFAGTQGVP